MNVQLSNLRRLNNFVAYFAPQMDLEKTELDKENSEKLIHYLVLIIDALIKSESLYKKRNFMLPDGKGFFTDNIIDLMTNINVYLFKFDTRVFNFSRADRQTFVFIIENLIDYFKTIQLYPDKNEKRNVFTDYRFWIENFFRVFDQKITGSIYPGKKVNLKNLFIPMDSVKSALVFSNATVNFSIFPFVINRGNQVIFLSRVTGSDLRYRDIDFDKEVAINNISHDIRALEFLLSNFDFTCVGLLRERVKMEDYSLAEKSDLIERAYNFHKEKLFNQSFNTLKELSFENVNLPLVYLLQIKNLVNMNRIFEVKRVMQKFILFYPYYAEGYEIMGDVYLKEENAELALNFYEKVLKITQNKRVAEKIKKLKETIAAAKEKAAKQKDDYFYDITADVFRSEQEIIFRERELRAMIEVLIANSRRNVMLVGESGVGKTSLIKLLAQRILSSEVPDPLLNKRIKEINFVSLLTGSKYRGQFEEKVLKLLTEFKLQNAILVLEDIHLMISSGYARGTSLDLVNILKPFLRENSIQVIATTNYEEFKNSLEKDNALLGFFQKITMSELPPAGTQEILKNLARNLFLKENIVIPADVAADIVEGAKRNIKGKKLPDSAIMVLERAVSRVKYKVHMGESSQLNMTQSDVVEVLSDMLNLPESNVSISLKSRLLDLRGNLLADIVGQDEAIERLNANIVTSKLDFDIKKNRPDGVFLFIGPTGVGKTETAIALSRALYGSEDYLIRIDMSEYMERFTYSRFVGAAPGYVGYTDANQLTDKVRQNPFSIILLDEIEKADSQLLNIFLQVFDAGRLTDARGNVVDFSHTTIIMTSNIGTALFSRSQMGYQGDPEGGPVSRAALIKSLKKYFSPEFLNRVDEIIIFKHLGEEDIKKIIDLQLQRTREHLEKEEKELVVKDEVIDYIIREGYSKEYGARNISRTLKSKILERIAETSLDKEWDDARYVICSLGQEEVEVSLEAGGSESLLDQELIEQLGEKKY